MGAARRGSFASRGILSPEIWLKSLATARAEFDQESGNVGPTSFSRRSNDLDCPPSRRQELSASSQGVGPRGLSTRRRRLSARHLLRLDRVCPSQLRRSGTQTKIAHVVCAGCWGKCCEQAPYVGRAH
ncbi:unnamed protein product [Lampetra planeri]